MSSKNGKIVIEKQNSLDSLKLDMDLFHSTLTEIRQFTRSLLQLGLHRVSQGTLEWINSLVINARIAKLINIEKELKRLTTSLIRYLQKSPTIKPSDFLNNITKIENYISLTYSILEEEHPYLTPIEIIGQARSVYVPTTEIKALCLGVRGWVSDTGFVGVTAYFLSNERSKDRIFTASNVRPMHYLQEKSPIFLYHLETYAQISFYELSEGFFRFQNVKLNQNNNLSFHKGLIINSLPKQDINFQNPNLKNLIYRDWVKLLQKIQEYNITPIPQLGQYERFIIIEPANYGEFDLDEITQLWKAPLYDTKGRQIMLIVSNQRHPHIANKITSFQKLFQRNFLPNSLFGELILSPKSSEVTFSPISGWYYQGIRLKKSWRNSQLRKRDQINENSPNVNLRLNFNFDLDSVRDVIFEED